MEIHQIFRASEEIKKSFSSEADTIFAYQVVDKLFDKVWCEETMDKLAGTKYVRRYFVLGKEIGNYKKPNIKYYLQLC